MVIGEIEFWYAFWGYTVGMLCLVVFFAWFYFKRGEE